VVTQITGAEITQMNELDKRALTWITTLPLYKKVPLDSEAAQRAAVVIQSFDGRFDQYCPACGQSATFATHVPADFSQQQKRLQAAAVNILSPGSGGVSRHVYRNFSKTAACTRQGHLATYHFQVFDDRLTKIGQFPSMADFSIGEIQQYRKALNESDMKSLSTAIGLHAHGVGAGAFIYLRRIFESLVEQAHVQALTDPDWDEDAYKLMRMAERLQALKLHLPEVLVRNSSLYSILSEHLHSLSEDECLANFEVVLQGIFVIADERLVQLQRQDRLANFNRSKGLLLGERAEHVRRVEGAK
jgi:hypothetical protein